MIKTGRVIIILCVLSTSILMNACAQYRPLEVQPVDGMAQGPGLFSGEDGEFVIYRKK